MASLMKVIGDSSSMIRAGITKPTAGGDDERVAATSENTRRGLLQDKFEKRKEKLIGGECQTKCYLLPATDLTVTYIPSSDQNK